MATFQVWTTVPVVTLRRVIVPLVPKAMASSKCSWRLALGATPLASPAGVEPGASRVGATSSTTVTVTALV